MNDKRLRFLSESGLEFFGTIAASTSHEINNVLSIVNEYSGLLGDLLEGAQRGRPIEESKLQRISKGFTDQVDRCRPILKRLNRFAHSVDEPSTAIDLDDLLDEIVHLAERLASMRGVELTVRESGGTVSVVSNPFRVQQAVFTCIGGSLEAAEKGSGIELYCEDEGAWARIVVEGPPATDSNGTLGLTTPLGILAEELGGSCETVKLDGQRHRCVLRIPKVAPAEAADSGEDGNRD
jgi:signal transduction histidine kinase